VGDDAWGRFCLDAMRGRGIDVSRVLADPALRTGVTVAISSPRDRALLSFLGSIAALTGTDVTDAALAAHQHLHVSSYYLQRGLRPGLPELMRRAHRLGLTTSLDPGGDPSQRWTDGLFETLAEVDLFFPNEVELAGITGCADVAPALARLQNGRTRVVAKLGARGVTTLEAGSLVALAAPRIEPVDTTGAGDSFDAGFLHAWLGGETLLACLQLGSACGALSTRGLGGTARQPSLTEAREFLAGAGGAWA